jgi:hypothetical protein
VYDTSKLKPNVLYFANENNPEDPSSHTYADLWFLSDNKDSDGKRSLVLIDVGGSGVDGRIGEKIEKLATFVNDQQTNVADFKLVGIVLAPDATPDAKSNGLEHRSSTLVCGREARNHLGGLDQLYHWLGNSSPSPSP